MKLHDRSGAVHVHSIHSDGSGTIPEIIRAARDARLDFLVLTDHSNRELHESGWQGWHDGLLVVIGAEIGTRHLPHLVALGIPDVTALKALPSGECLAHIKDLGGVSFVAHPRGKRMIGMSVPPWHAWENQDYTGVEVWSYMHDWIEEFRWRRLRSFYRSPDSKITGPHPEVLAAWDGVAMRRRVSGIVGLDAHAKPLLWRWFKFFPYDMLFRTTLTHVLVEEFTGDGETDVRAVTWALAQGRCYMGYHVPGDPTGFRFWAQTDSGEVEMGEEVALEDGLTLRVSLPAEGEMRLVACGQEAALVTGTRAEFHPAGRGPHRVEVRRDASPWIFSNHLYVK